MNGPRLIGSDISIERDQAWVQSGTKRAARVKPQNAFRNTLGNCEAARLAEVLFPQRAFDRHGLSPPLKAMVYGRRVNAGAHRRRRASRVSVPQAAQSQRIDHLFLRAPRKTFHERPSVAGETDRKARRAVLVRWAASYPARTLPFTTQSTGDCFCIHCAASGGTDGSKMRRHSSARTAN